MKTKKPVVKKKTGVLIIEDNPLLRDGISAMVKEQADFKVKVAFSEKEKSLSKISKLKPDVILIDLGLRSHNSLKIVESLKKKSKIKTIVMDLMPEEGDILDYIKAGASGFIFKDTKVDDFLETIRSVAAGKEVLPPEITGSLFSEIIKRAMSKSKKADLRNSFKMTKREKEVIKLIADGLSNKEMGSKLRLSPFIIKSHVHNILEKMALHKRVQIAASAQSNELKK